MPFFKTTVLSSGFEETGSLFTPSAGAGAAWGVFSTLVFSNGAFGTLINEFFFAFAGLFLSWGLSSRSSAEVILYFFATEEKEALILYCGTFKTSPALGPPDKPVYFLNSSTDILNFLASE